MTTMTNVASAGTVNEYDALPTRGAEAADAAVAEEVRGDRRGVVRGRIRRALDVARAAEGGGEIDGVAGGHAAGVA